MAPTHRACPKVATGSPFTDNSIHWPTHLVYFGVHKHDAPKRNPAPPARAQKSKALEGQAPRVEICGRFRSVFGRRHLQEDLKGNGGIVELKESAI